MDIPVTIAKKVSEYMVAPIGHQFGYIIFYNSYVANLKAQLQNLEVARNGCLRSIDVASKKGEVIEETVQNWLKEVDKAIVEVNVFLENAKVGCLNLWSKRQLGRKASKTAQIISRILENKFDKISYCPPLHMAVPASTRGYEALESRTSILHEIMQALKDEDIYLIGVFGMSGVGKTALVKELEWHVEQKRTFGAVVFAYVGNSPNVRKIQGEIADRLGLKFDEETEAGRASRLRVRIKNESNILVILDDIWKSLNLTEVGIPFGEDHKGCKLLMTSRNLNVLKNEMSTQKEFKLEVLSERESWSLFEKKIGDVFNDTNIQYIAKKVVKKCAHLPLYIVTVATTLKKNKDFCIWNDALIKLTQFGSDTVYSAIKLSYDNFESDELRSFFLFIGSFGNGHSIHDLSIYGWCLGLYRGIETLADTRNRVYKLTNDLSASCLLLEGENNCVRMYDIVYDIASLISLLVEPFFSGKQYIELEEWPMMNSLQGYHGIFLPRCNIKKLSERLHCPQLKILVLNNLGDYLKVLDNFLNGMRELKVLNLEGLDCYSSPPLFLSHSTNLCALSLCQCILKDITIVAELTRLEVLRLNRSKIEELPSKLGRLTRLQLLDLTDCSRLRVIPTNVISSFTCMEELYMGNCCIQWEIEESKSLKNHASLGDLRHLRNLTVLNLQIQDASIFPRDLLIFGKL